MELGLGEIHAESIGELHRIQAIANRLECQVAVALRVNPNVDIPGAGAIRMGGRATPFGIDEDQLGPAIAVAEQATRIRLVGLHLNTGTQMLDAEVVLHQYQYAIELTRQVSQQIDRPLEVLNLGGGLGIPYFAGQPRLELTKLAAGLKNLIGKLATDNQLKELQIVIEPGRYLVGEAGVYLTRVVDRKISRDQTFLVVDGGMHHHLAASGNFGQVVKRPFPSAAANRLDEAPQLVASLVGPLCTPLDTLGRNILLPTACGPGDIVAVFQSGAYAVTASPLLFLGHPPPAEVWVARGQARLISPRFDPPCASRS